MRRRRPIRPGRPPRRPGRPGIRKRALQRLNLAHNLLENEEFEQAGAAFEDLGNLALRRRAPRAAQLFLQAGKAYLMAGNSQLGTDMLITGLRLVPRMGPPRKTPIIGRRILDSLREMELHHEYRVVENELNQLLETYELKRDIKVDIRSDLQLPSKCPYCGGTVHPNEVDWVNENSVECNYCGSIVEGKI